MSFAYARGYKGREPADLVVIRLRLTGRHQCKSFGRHYGCAAE